MTFDGTSVKFSLNNTHLWIQQDRNFFWRIFVFVKYLVILHIQLMFYASIQFRSSEFCTRFICIICRSVLFHFILIFCHSHCSTMTIVTLILLWNLLVFIIIWQWKAEVLFNITYKIQFPLWLLFCQITIKLLILKMKLVQYCWQSAWYTRCYLQEH